MHELEELSLLTRSGMTRLIDRIEAAGLVRRERSAEDRRGVYLTPTESGADKIAAVWPDHVKSITHHFGRHIDRDDARSLTQISRKIEQGEGS